MDKAAPIFVAGHAGLIGSAFLRRLTKEGHTNIITRPRADLDLADRAQVKAFFEAAKPAVVILAAGKVGGIVENKNFPADFIYSNLAIQLSVFGAARDSGVEKLLFFGSSCMYPRECRQPMKEDYLLQGKPEPTSIAYAIAKLAGVEMCLAHNRQYGVNRFIPVIPNSAYGPNDDFDLQSAHVLSALIRRFDEAKQRELGSVTLWGTGSPRREFIHADDIVDACYLLLGQDDAAIDLPINIGVGTDYSIRELAELIAKIVGFKGTIEWDSSKPDGAPRKLLDNSQLQRLGWRPQVELEDGIRQTYRWFLQHKGKFSS